MKYLVVIGNGLTDQPVAERDNHTPLQLADIPSLHRLAIEGRTGSVRTVPEGMPVSGEVSSLSLLGFDPKQQGRSAGHYLARALGVEVKGNEVPLVCDFIILQSSHNDMIVKDFTAGQIADADAKQLLDALQEQVDTDYALTFHPGNGYQNLMVIESSPFPSRLEPPNELIGEGIRQHLRQEREYSELVHIMNQAQIILHNHPFNKQRAGAGEDAVNSVWFHGNRPGEPPGADKKVPGAEKDSAGRSSNGSEQTSAINFFSRYEKKAAMITPSLVLKGMAMEAGMDVIDVPGATGFPGSNYKGKVDAALDALKTHDVVFVNVTGAEYTSLQGNIDDKIAALEDFDQQVLGPILDAMETDKDITLMVTENHMSSVDLMRYKDGPVPFVVYPSQKGKDAVDKFDEDIVQSGSEHFKDGPALMEALLKGAL